MSGTGGSDHYTKCGATRRDGGSCLGAAMRGSTRCRVHGGTAPQTLAKAARSMAEVAVVNQARAYGTPRHVGPLGAVEEELSRSAGIVSFLDGKLAEEVDPGWLAVYQSERRHYSDLALKMLTLGAQERREVLTEQQVDALETVLIGVLRDCGLDPSTSHVRGVIARHLRRVTDQADVVDGDVVTPADEWFGPLVAEAW